MSLTKDKPKEEKVFDAYCPGCKVKNPEYDFRISLNQQGDAIVVLIPAGQCCITTVTCRKCGRIFSVELTPVRTAPAPQRNMIISPGGVYRN